MKTWTRRRALSLGIALGAFGTLTTGSYAGSDDYPARPVKVVVPFAAGGSSDTAARIASKFISRHLNGSVVVENRLGASGSIGTEYVAKSVADGYTLVLSAAVTFDILPYARKVNYDAQKDFVALGQIWSSPQVLVVNKTSPYKTIGDIVEAAKNNPGKISFGSAGIGTTTYMSVQLLQELAGVKFINVPYHSIGPAVTDLMGDHVTGLFADIGEAAPMVSGGRLRGIVITSDKRSPQIQDVPTSAEAGYPKLQTVNWFGLQAPAGTPPAVVEKLRKAIEAAQRDPEYKQTLAKLGITTGTIGAQQFGELIERDRGTWKPLIEQLHLSF